MYLTARTPEQKEQMQTVAALALILFSAKISAMSEHAQTELAYKLSALLNGKAIDKLSYDALVQAISKQIACELSADNLHTLSLTFDAI
jgi:hypothetical protein